MKKHKRKEFTFPALLAIGSGLSLGAVPTVALALAAVAYFTKDPSSLTGAFSLLSLLLAGAISGLINSRVTKEGGALIGILSAVISAAVMLAVGLIWRGGLLPAGAVLNLAAYITVSVGAALLGKRRIGVGRRHGY